MNSKARFIRYAGITFSTALLLLTPSLGSKTAKAQVAEPVFPLPNSTNIASSQPIEVKLTEQPQIQTGSIQILLNGLPLDGNLSVNTRDLSLSFEATPPNYRLGNNTLTVQFQTQDSIQSEFSWPFKVETSAASVEATEVVATAPQTVVPLMPELTNQAITGNTLTLSGKTRPGARVTVNITATRPVSSLVDLGPFSVTTGRPAPREMSSTVVADSEGVFTTSFNVTADPVETEYVVEAIAAQGEAEETTTTRFQRSARP